MTWTKQIEFTCRGCGATASSVEPTQKYCGRKCYWAAPRSKLSEAELHQRRLVVFMPKVDRSGGPDACWPWLGRREEGYGVFGHGTRAHRFALELSIGKPLGELCALHRCDNPPCCNPAHLFAGTSQENAADRHSKGRTHAKPWGDRHWSRQRPDQVLRGEQIKGSKLNDDLVREIRRLAKTNTQARLAEKFGIHVQTVYKIVARVSWAHVSEVD